MIAIANALRNDGTCGVCVCVCAMHAIVFYRFLKSLTDANYNRFHCCRCVYQRLSLNYDDDCKQYSIPTGFVLLLLRLRSTLPIERKQKVDRNWPNAKSLQFHRFDWKKRNVCCDSYGTKIIILLSLHRWTEQRNKWACIEQRFIPCSSDESHSTHSSIPRVSVAPTQNPRKNSNLIWCARSNEYHVFGCCCCSRWLARQLQCARPCGKNWQSHIDSRVNQIVLCRTDVNRWTSLFIAETRQTSLGLRCKCLCFIVYSRQMAYIIALEDGFKWILFGNFNA